jgi:deoxyribonuclease V
MHHNWNLSPKDAIELQKQLRNKVALKPYTGNIRTVAGADVSLNRFEEDIYAGIIVLSYPDLLPLTCSVVHTKTSFPYVPGLLSFREAPSLLECYEKLDIRPDITFVDGHGIAHPRHLGIASHFGVLTDSPTIGVAKSRLYGAYNNPEDIGESSEMFDLKTGEVLGYAYKSKERSKPVLISPGHNITAIDAVEIVKSTFRGYRLPEPTRMAHNLVNSFRKGEALQEYKAPSV